MFGKNAHAPIETHLDGTTLEVTEIFHTLQGEGPHAGVPAVFVRLRGCPISCCFCDTLFETGDAMTLDAIFREVDAVRAGSATTLIVLTGGEPLRQNVLPFIAQSIERGMRVQIETAGIVYIDGLDKFATDEPITDASFSIVCSPKTPKVQQGIVDLCRDWKYIVRVGETDEDGFPNTDTQRLGKSMRIFRPPVNRGDRVWVQPCQDYSHAILEIGKPAVTRVDDMLTRENTEHAIKMCLAHGFRLSLQTHKMVGLP